MVKVLMFTVDNCQPATPFVWNIQEIINRKLRDLNIPDKAIVNINITLPNGTYTREIIIITKGWK